MSAVIQIAYKVVLFVAIAAAVASSVAMVMVLLAYVAPAGVEAFHAFTMWREADLAGSHSPVEFVKAGVGGAYLIGGYSVTPFNWVAIQTFVVGVPLSILSIMTARAMWKLGSSS